MEGSDGWLVLLTFMGGCAFTLAVTRWVRRAEREDLRAQRRVARLEPRFDMLREFGIAVGRYLYTVSYYNSAWYAREVQQWGAKHAGIAVGELVRDVRSGIDALSASFVADVVAKDPQVREAVQELQVWVLRADLFWKEVQRGSEVEAPEIDHEAVSATVAKLCDRLDKLLDDWSG